MGVTIGIDQLGIDADLPLPSPNASFQHISHAEFAADLLGVDRPASQCEGGIARDYKRPVDSRQVSRQIVGDPIGKILMCSVFTVIGERQYDDRQPRPRALRFASGVRAL